MQSSLDIPRATERQSFTPPYTLIEDTGFDIRSLGPSFAALPRDQYVRAGDNRLRRYSSLLATKAPGQSRQLEWLPHGPFWQSAKVNSYAGDILREFEELDPDLKWFAQQELIPFLLSQLPISVDEVKVGVHAFRITATAEAPGKPAPEGPHRDDEDFLAIMCIARENVAEDSGITSLLMPEGGEPPLYEGILQPGHILLLDDRKVFHYTTPIFPANAEEACHRDVMVVDMSVVQ